MMDNTIFKICARNAPFKIAEGYRPCDQGEYPCGTPPQKHPITQSIQLPDVSATLYTHKTDQPRQE